MDELVGLLKRIFESRWMEEFDELSMGVYNDFLRKTATVTIQNCKKYILYENTSLENILLMTWYLDIYMVDFDMRVRLLVDPETEAVYYLKITEEEGKIKEEQTEREESVPLAGEISQNARYYMEYFNAYYGGDMDELTGFTEKKWQKEDAWYLLREEGKQNYLMQFILPYGNYKLDFEVRTGGGKKGENISLGILQLKMLIPEMIQD